MLLSIIDEVNKALDNDLCLAALTIVLTIPDICGKAEYPSEKIGVRYVQWYDKYIGQHEKTSDKDCSGMFPYISGEVIYSLRNNVLHQGTPNIETHKIKDVDNKIDRFILVKEPKNKFDVYFDTSFYNVEKNEDHVDTKKEYCLSIRRLCFIITRTAKGYYEDNKGKFDFFNYELVDYTDLAKISVDDVD